VAELILIILDLPDPVAEAAESPEALEKRREAVRQKIRAVTKMRVSAVVLC
jgi:hypothetical protein